MVHVVAALALMVVALAALCVVAWQAYISHRETMRRYALDSERLATERHLRTAQILDGAEAREHQVRLQTAQREAYHEPTNENPPMDNWQSRLDELGLIPPAVVEQSSGDDPVFAQRTGMAGAFGGDGLD